MSQIIPLGIGSPAKITQLVLTGLSNSFIPPPPPPEPTPGEVLLPGLVGFSYELFSSIVPSNGAEFALPEFPVEVTWQTIYQTPPGVANIAIEVSLDNENWGSIDTTTEVGGEIRTFITSANFIRASMLAGMTVGVVTTVALSVRRISNAWF